MSLLFELREQSRYHPCHVVRPLGPRLRLRWIPTLLGFNNISPYLYRTAQQALLERQHGGFRTLSSIHHARNRSRRSRASSPLQGTQEEVRRAQDSFWALRERKVVNTVPRDAQEAPKTEHYHNQSLPSYQGESGPAKSILHPLDDRADFHEPWGSNISQEAPLQNKHRQALQGSKTAGASLSSIESWEHYDTQSIVVSKRFTGIHGSEEPTTACVQNAGSHSVVDNSSRLSESEICMQSKPGDTTNVSIAPVEGQRGSPQGNVHCEATTQSKRKRPSTKRFSTPSETLLYSLGSLSQQYAISKSYPNKVDLSHIDPMAIARHGRRAIQQELQRHNAQKTPYSVFPTPKSSLQRLLAEYLHACWPIKFETNSTKGGPRLIVADEKALHLVFSEQNVKYIRDQGYEPEDIVSWAWILTAKSTIWAARRLMALTTDSSKDVSDRRPIPIFVFLFILRREKWNARTLTEMIAHAWDRLEGRIESRGKRLGISCDSSTSQKSCLEPNSASHQSISENTIVVMVIRLLRHARKVLPEACISITAMLTKHVRGQRFGSPTASRKPPPIARLTFLYNSMLSLLALPSSMSPFLSTSAQQRAQYNILRSMNEFVPPLAIDREGYRAVIRVQMASKKTSQERDWASLKARSWPPWKEDKDGNDVEKDPQYGMSQASLVIKQLEEAGYAVQQWELSADILAGWDTDRSPTIQKRVLLPRPIMSRRLAPKEETGEPPSKMNIWAARIQATRTIDEAWANFLNYKDQLNGDYPPSGSCDVYHSMFEKLVFEQRRLRAVRQEKFSNDSPSPYSTSTPLPGDGKEVFEKPGSQEAIHVRSSPPNIDEFYNAMVDIDGVFPSHKLLAFLLIHASSFRVGIHYLNHSRLPKDLVKALLLGDPNVTNDPRYTTVMPSYLFAAFVTFLCNFAPHVSYRSKLPYVHLAGASVKRSARPRINPLAQACRLMGARKPDYRPPWTSLLAALARSGVLIESLGENIDDRMQDILAWTAIRSVVGQMHKIDLGLDFAGFRFVCIGYEKAVVAKAELVDAPDSRYLDERLDSDGKTFLDSGLTFIKGLFKSIVSEQSEHQMNSTRIGSIPAIADLLPRLLEVPSPAHLHAFIRALGLGEDQEGLLKLLEWMARFSPDIQVKADEMMNGKRMLRTCLTAARAFLEQSWLAPEQRMMYGGAADHSGCMKKQHYTENESSRSFIQRLEQVVDSNPRWGGWPTDEEVEIYVHKTWH